MNLNKNIDINFNFNFNNKIKVYAFVGPSGTGKSYRAQMVAGEYDIHYIIDDGLFIKDNEVIAGNSAKKAPTKIETVKHALFLTEEEKQEVISSILPLFGWYIKKNNDKCDIFYIMKLAYSQTVRYTETYGK